MERSRNHAAARREGLALARAGDTAKAVPLLRRAAALDPRDGPIRGVLGALLAERNALDEAIRMLEEAVALGAADANAFNTLGVAFYRQGRAEEAVARYDAALAAAPGMALAHFNRGVALAAVGRIAEARAALEAALAADPDHAEALVELASLEQARPGTALARRIGDRLAAPGLGDDERARLGFALGAIHERGGDFGRAFAFIKAANDARRARLAADGRGYDRTRQAALVDAIIGAFPDSGFFAARRRFGAETEVPLFVVGLPRSGTTLVEQILASHPWVAGAGETGEVQRLADSIPIGVVTVRSGRPVGVVRDGTAGGYPRGVPALGAAEVRRLAEAFLARIAKAGRGAVRVVEKTPFNFLHLGLIALMFPRSRVVHCRRDVLDACLSCYCQDFAAGYAFSHDLDDLAHYAVQYRRLMAHWRAALPLRMLELDYESLVAEPEPEMRRLVAFAGLPWDAACLDFRSNPRAVLTASQHQVRRPIGAGSVGRWRRYRAFLGDLERGLMS